MARPNILLIMADQHRWDCVGFNGNRQVQTPHLDRLAQDAVNYPQAICPYPVCTPSRYSLLCGQYVHQHGGWNNRCTLEANIPTFPRLLAEHGYRTRAVGKMHMTPTYLDVGLHELELCEQDGDGRFDDDYHRELMRAGLVDAIDLYDQRREFRVRAPQAYWQSFGAQPSNLPEAWHSTTWIGERAVRTLESWSEEGNLLICSFVKPHHPFDPPLPWATLYDPAELDLLPGWTEAVPPGDPVQAYFDNSQLTEASMRQIMAYYFATISQIDHQIGRMVAVLRRRHLYDNTMILYLSDHGEYMGYRHMILKQGHPYEPLARVPLLIKYPGNVGGGTTRATLANLIDVAPTILHQAGVTTPPEMAGLDLQDPNADREYAFLEHTVAGYYMARSRTHKLIWDRDPSRCQFFDLRADPLEMHNRMDDPEVQPLIADFREAIVRWRLFDSRPALRLNPQARQIERHPAGRIGERDLLRIYFEQQAAPFLQG
ncbi:sulfatase-like hydrolase/transferase [Litorilinea aerophila]|uniref:Sulfatase-like hydrolase/transferase n=1 Tax=Litorilinea aerophila TaxID=1204385 RepID=A0A540VEX8_9CHLR|nr:sulfatase-like hydrolase/transferase [Litorilinea aerophila]MCC9077051.1 sulfatase-like hydrolase/transferase [Litorilinea aerophila]